MHSINTIVYYANTLYNSYYYYIEMSSRSDENQMSRNLQVQVGLNLVY